MAQGAPHSGRTALDRTTPRFECAVCGEGFNRQALYEHHLAASHPPPVATPTAIERALAGIDFPAWKRDLVSQVAARGRRDPEVLALLKGLPARRYRDAADVGVAIGELKGRHPRKQPRRRQA
jgi:hypothetical protein